MLGPLTPEARLVLLTAGSPRVDAAIRARLEAGVRWPEALTLAAYELAEPAFDRALKRAAAGLLPPEVVEDLHRRELVTGLRASYMVRRLDETLGLLEEAGIAVTLLKGAALIRAGVHLPLDRPMSDLDLLVDPGEASAARDLLEAGGWASRSGGDSDDWYDDLHHLPPLGDTQAPDLHVSLELHTDLFPPARNPFAFGPAQLEAEPRSGSGATRIPSDEALLLHCCLHFAWSHLLKIGAWRAFRDVSGLVDPGRIQWPRFVEAARGARGASCAYWTLFLARELAQAAIPGDVLDHLRPRNPAPVQKALEMHFKSDIVPDERNVKRHRIRRRLWEAAIRPTSQGHGPLRPWSGPNRDWASKMTAEQS